MEAERVLLLRRKPEFGNGRLRGVLGKQLIRQFLGQQLVSWKQQQRQQHPGQLVRFFEQAVTDAPGKRPQIAPLPRDVLSGGAPKQEVMVRDASGSAAL